MIKSQQDLDNAKAGRYLMVLGLFLVAMPLRHHLNDLLQSVMLWVFILVAVMFHIWLISTMFLRWSDNRKH